GDRRILAASRYVTGDTGCCNGELEGSMESPISVSELCERHKVDHRQLAAKTGLDEQRVLAIALGRWTPSPEERDKIAAALGLPRALITRRRAAPPTAPWCPLLATALRH